MLVEGLAVMALIGLGARALTRRQRRQEQPEETRRMGNGYLILAGRQYPVNVPVDHALVFSPGMPGTRARTRPVQFGVMHWTGGEGSGPTVYDVLRGRGLSVHFIIDRAGTIWQCADPAFVQCAHVGTSPNEISWGVEITNYGAARTPPAAGAARPRYETIIRGERKTVADFLPAQYTAIWELFNTVHTALQLPKTVYSGSAELIPWRQLQDFRGVVGHFHISNRKNDPGTRPLQWLAQRWAGTPRT
jgi:N-acetyl-anhydromuramyl-L-alanine amidase AmpD